MVLDVTAKDPQGVQVFGETKTFNMIGYTEKDRKGQTTLDNWLIRSWDDLALPQGRNSYTFEVPLPGGVEQIQVQASLTYQVGDSQTPMTQASRTFSVGR